MLDAIYNKACYNGNLNCYLQGKKHDRQNTKKDKTVTVRLYIYLPSRGLVFATSGHWVRAGRQFVVVYTYCTTLTTSSEIW